MQNITQHGRPFLRHIDVGDMVTGKGDHLAAEQLG
jgi:hypothetical protein